MSKKPGKGINHKYMDEITSQPSDVYMYVRLRNQNLSVDVLMGMFARLLVVLVSRGWLYASELRYIVTGSFVAGIRFSDWSPDYEIEQGPPPPLIGD